MTCKAGGAERREAGSAWIVGGTNSETWLGYDLKPRHPNRQYNSLRWTYNSTLRSGRMWHSGFSLTGKVCIERFQ